MTVTEALGAASPTTQAIALLIIVLLEAAALHLGYGLLEDALAPSVFERLQRS
ncbi:hypothetical protein [Halorubrum sp. JWXQ-INN 858]|uniref:DUF7512 family protein n=1 Tax=Halorubrum sp. JWXQ-INN 858 TaxID=2690782 RepID=UPI0013596957|nr:hypothetical protein [Halorubrum sp. JWXQ-INN 858]